MFIAPSPTEPGRTASARPTFIYSWRNFASSREFPFRGYARVRAALYASHLLRSSRVRKISSQNCSAYRDSAVRRGRIAGETPELPRRLTVFWTSVITKKCCNKNWISIKLIYLLLFIDNYNCVYWICICRCNCWLLLISYRMSLIVNR